MSNTLISRGALDTAHTSRCEPPFWCAARPDAPWTPGQGGVFWRRAETPEGVLLSARACAEGASDLTRRTMEIYAGIHDRIAGSSAAHPVRFWNFVPEILGAADGARNRYMCFNAGRFAVMQPWMLRRGHAVAATAVGNPNTAELIVHCLARAAAGRPIENPRQIPAFRYSLRYGPQPPVFARAMWLPERRALLVSGTASVVGEASVGEHDLQKQLRTTLGHLRTITREAVARTRVQWRLGPSRIYIKRLADAPEILDQFLAAFPSAGAPEVLITDLCRPELLVEIEGVASAHGARRDV